MYNGNIVEALKRYSGGGKDHYWSFILNYEKERQKE